MDQGTIEYIVVLACIPACIIAAALVILARAARVKAGEKARIAEAQARQTKYEYKLAALHQEEQRSQRRF